MAAETGFTVGDVVRKLRKDKRWSIRKLATESGVGRMTISAIENNESNYQKETLEALAGVFGKTAAELESVITTRPQRRMTDLDLPPEWLSFARRCSRLTRQGQGFLLSLLLFLEDLGAVRHDLADNEPPSLGGREPPEIAP